MFSYLVVLLILVVWAFALIFWTVFENKEVQGLQNDLYISNTPLVHFGKVTDCMVEESFKDFDKELKTYDDVYCNGNRIGSAKDYVFIDDSPSPSATDKKTKNKKSKKKTKKKSKKVRK